MHPYARRSLRRGSAGTSTTVVSTQRMEQRQPTRIPDEPEKFSSAGKANSEQTGEELLERLGGGVWSSPALPRSAQRSTTPSSTHCVFGKLVEGVTIAIHPRTGTLCVIGCSTAVWSTTPLDPHTTCHPQGPAAQHPRAIRCSAAPRHMPCGRVQRRRSTTHLQCRL